MKILVTGGSGQLGSAVVREFAGARGEAPAPARAHDVVAPSHQALDITRHHDVMSFVSAERPDAVINCAGYNNVDGAQDHVVPALEANAFAVRSLARAAAEVGAILVHYSSDFVFSGDTDRPYTEDDQPGPRSFYSISKLLGEWFAREAPRAYVLRVESLFGHFAAGAPVRSSLGRIAQSLLEGRETLVFSDRTVSPSFVVDVTWATRQLVERHAVIVGPRLQPGAAPQPGAAQPPVAFGLYHCVNAGHCTWEELARELARHLNVEPHLVPRAMADVPLRAARPRYCALSPAKLAAAGIVMPSWHDALARYVAGL